MTVQKITNNQVKIGSQGFSESKDNGNMGGGSSVTMSKAQFVQKYKKEPIEGDSV